MKTKLSLAILGAGLVGQQHIKTIATSKLASLHSIIDISKKTHDIAKQSKTKWYRSLDKLFAEGPLPDGIIVATPTNLHTQHVLKIIKKKIPILIEKPIADTIKNAKKIIKESKKEKVDICIGYQRRHGNIAKFIKKKLSQGIIGEIIAVNGTCWLFKPEEYFKVKWRIQKGAGPLGINLVHDIDLLYYWLGPVKSVLALTSNAKRKRIIEDTASVILEFNSGTICNLSVSDTIVAPWSYELTAGDNPAYPLTDQSSYMIGGTKGSLQIPNIKLWFNKERSWWKPIYSKKYNPKIINPLINQISNFCNVIKKKERPLVAAEDGLESLKIFEAILESSKMEKKIYI